MLIIAIESGKHLFTQIHKLQNHVQMSRIRYAAMGCFVLYLIACLSSSTDVLTILIGGGSNVLFVISYTCWYSGRILMILVFVTRLKSALKNTKWAYHRYVFRCLHLMLAFIMTLTCMECIILIIVNTLCPKHC